MDSSACGRVHVGTAILTMVVKANRVIAPVAVARLAKNYQETCVYTSSDNIIPWDALTGSVI